MREEGFYWIKIFGIWTIGHWYGEYWGQILGYEEGATRNVEEVDENKLVHP